MSVIKMNLEKRIKFTKCLVYTYVIILAFTGIVQVVAGIYFLWSHLRYNRIQENLIWGPAAALFALGPLTLILCYTTWKAIGKKNRSKLGCGSFFLLLFICIQFAACGWAIYLREVTADVIPNPIDLFFEEYLSKGIREVDSSNYWNRLQSDLQCCGIDGPSDYRRGLSAIPWACCSESNSEQVQSCTMVYQRGCLPTLIMSTRRNLLIIGLSAFFLSLIQSVGLFCILQLISLYRKAVDAENAVHDENTPRCIRELKPLSDRSLRYSSSSGAVNLKNATMMRSSTGSR